VAVYKSLGIGLGFNFDHTSKPGEDELPNTRRLQARAAKSAIRRVQEIYDAEGARKMLDAIKDPNERNRKADEMRRDAAKEVQFLADRLSNLLPNDLSLYRNKRSRIEAYNSFVLQSPRPTSRVIEELLSDVANSSNYEIDYLNPSGKSMDKNGDEFIEQWENDRLSSIPGTSDGDHDDDIKTVLA
jgi:hypothetical protein